MSYFHYDICVNLSELMYFHDFHYGNWTFSTSKRNKQQKQQNKNKIKATKQNKNNNNINNNQGIKYMVYLFEYHQRVAHMHYMKDSVLK